jgi:predicted dehydrogenase
LKPVETYSGKLAQTGAYEEVDITTEDYASVLLRFENGAHGNFTVNQAAAGRKNRLYYEIYGSKQSVSWSSEHPNEFWIGSRDTANHLFLKDPALVDKSALAYMGYPGGHNEGYPDTLKQSFAQFYKSIAENSYYDNSGLPYATFEAGKRIIETVEKIYDSAKSMAWMDI